MVQVEMSDDIRSYEIKTIGPFTTRQVVCILIGLVLGIPVAILLPTTIEFKFLGLLIVAGPVFLCGSTTVDGTHLEVLAIRFIYKLFLTPPRRKVKSPCSYREALKDYEKKALEYQLRKLPEKKRKEYLKRKKKKNVKYSQKKAYHVYI